MSDELLVHCIVSPELMVTLWGTKAPSVTEIETVAAKRGTGKTVRRAAMIKRLNTLLVVHIYMSSCGISKII
jgi:hypothetical protein